MTAMMVHVQCLLPAAAPDARGKSDSDLGQVHVQPAMGQEAAAISAVEMHHSPAVAATSRSSGHNASLRRVS